MDRVEKHPDVQVAQDDFAGHVVGCPRCQRGTEANDHMRLCARGLVMLVHCNAVRRRVMAEVARANVN